MYDVVDQTGTITAGGAGVLAHLPTPGQRALLTFSATAGQIVTALGTGVTIPGLPDYQISVLDPFNVTLNFSQTNTPNWLERTTIVTTGTHTVLVDPRGAASGDATVTLYNVPADASGSATVNGATVPLTTTVPGQRVLVTFTGTSGQSVTVKFTGVSMNPTHSPNALWSNPSGGTVQQRALFSPTDQFGPVTLTATGTYTVLVDPQYQDTGSVTIQVTSP